jgi:hypothetical protein
MWQFAELGFDYSIYWPDDKTNPETRMSPKPVKWSYLKDPDRYRLYKINSALTKLKTSYPLFRTSNFELSANPYDKRIRLWDDGYVNSDFIAVIAGNFDVTAKNVWPEFTQAGKWYDYLTQDSIIIAADQTEKHDFKIFYQPGEWHIYTTKKLPKPDLKVPPPDGINEQSTDNDQQLTNAYPNPFSNELHITYSLFANDKVTVKIYDIIGEEVKTLCDAKQSAGTHTLIWDGTNNSGSRAKDGYYIYSFSTSKATERKKISLLH